jgi:hypothetical protein
MLACDIIKHGGSSSLQGAMQQQLQQTGLLQHQADVMSALAADLSADAAHISVVAADSIIHDANTHIPLDGNVTQMAMNMCLITHSTRMLWVSDTTWLCDPSAHATAAMRLSTAVLQHVSSSAQHVLPVMLQAAPQQGEALLAALQGQARVARVLSSSMLDAVRRSQLPPASQPARELPQLNEAAVQHSPQLQRLLLDPDLMQCLAAQLVHNAYQLQVILEATRGAGAGPNLVASASPFSSSSSSSSSSSKAAGQGASSAAGSSKGLSSSQQLQQPQDPAAAAAAVGSSSSSNSGTHVKAALLEANQPCFSPCQLKLLEYIRVSPTTMTWGLGSCSLLEAVGALSAALDVYSYVHKQYRQHIDGLASQQQQQKQQQQRQQVQSPTLPVLQSIWMLFLLLPVTLLRCTTELLRAYFAARQLQQQPQQLDRELLKCIVMLLDQCQSAAHIRLGLRVVDGDRGQAGQVDVWYRRNPPAVWAGEMLEQTLQVADVLVLQQPLQQEHLQLAAIAGLAGAGPVISSSSSRERGVHPDAWLILLQIAATADVLCLLPFAVMAAVRCEDDVALAELASTGAVTPYTQAHRALGQVISTMEAALRVVTASAMAGIWGGPGLVNSVALARRVCCQSGGFPSELHGLLQQSDASSQAYGQFYSLLSTLMKLGKCALRDDTVWQEQNAGCCYVAAEAAVLLLHPCVSGSGVSAGQPGSSSISGSVPLSPPPQPAAAAADRQAVHVLPSLAIFGRSCLHWAWELQQQTHLLLQQQWQQVRVDSAAAVCIGPPKPADPGALTRVLWL